MRGCWQGNQQLSDVALAHCARMPSLQHLETSNCWHLTDAGLTRLTALTTLAHLDLSYCWQVGATFFAPEINLALPMACVLYLDLGMAEP